MVNNLEISGAPVDATAGVHHPLLNYLIQPMTIILKFRDGPAKPGEDSPLSLKPATDPDIWKDVLDTMAGAHDLCRCSWIYALINHLLTLYIILLQRR